MFLVQSPSTFWIRATKKRRLHQPRCASIIASSESITIWRTWLTDCRSISKHHRWWRRWRVAWCLFITTWPGTGTTRRVTRNNHTVSFECFSFFTFFAFFVSVFRLVNHRYVCFTIRLSACLPACLSLSILQFPICSSFSLSRSLCLSLYRPDLIFLSQLRCSNLVVSLIESQESDWLNSIEMM